MSEPETWREKVKEKLGVLLVLLILAGPTVALFLLLRPYNEDAAAWIAALVGIPTSVGIAYLCQRYAEPRPRMTKKERDELVAYFEEKLQGADYVGLGELNAFHTLQSTPVIDPKADRRFRIILGMVLVVLLSILALAIAALV